MTLDIEALKALREKAVDTASEYPRLNPHASVFHTELIAAFPALVAEIERLRGALNRIASWDEGAEVGTSFDEPHSAEIARAALSQESDPHVR